MKTELERLAVAIAAFTEVDIGYPKEVHEILPQARSAAEIAVLLRSLGVSPASRLNELYQLCDGIELPNVDNLYCVHGLDLLRTVKNMASEPVQFAEREIHFFGSDGGGGRFVVTLDSDEVYYLPVGEVTPQRVYAGEAVELIAETVDEWIAQLAERVEQAAGD